MPTLTIRHLTTYRYLRPVAFGEHRMMLRPRDSHDQRVIETSLEIYPQPASLHFIVDDFGNQIGIAQFSGCAQELCVESVVCLEQSPPEVSARHLDERAGRFPFAYSDEERTDLMLYLERLPVDSHSDPDDEVTRWAHESCRRPSRSAPSTFSPGSRRPSIPASATGGARPRACSELSRR
jgi:hypothetical protein